MSQTEQYGPICWLLAFIDVLKSDPGCRLALNKMIAASTRTGGSSDVWDSLNAYWGSRFPEGVAMDRIEEMRIFPDIEISFCADFREFSSGVQEALSELSSHLSKNKRATLGFILTFSHEEDGHAVSLVKNASDELESYTFGQSYVGEKEIGQMILWFCMKFTGKDHFYSIYEVRRAEEDSPRNLWFPSKSLSPLVASPAGSEASGGSTVILTDEDSQRSPTASASDSEISTTVPPRMRSRNQRHWKTLFEVNTDLSEHVNEAKSLPASPRTSLHPTRARAHSSP